MTIFDEEIRLNHVTGRHQSWHLREVILKGCLGELDGTDIAISRPSASLIRGINGSRKEKWKNNNEGQGQLRFDCIDLKMVTK